MEETLPRKLRLMHLVWRLDAAGMENGVINICNRLPNHEFAPSICTFSPGGAAESRIDDQRVDLLNTTRHMGNDPTLPIRLAWQLRRRKVDILHTHNWVTLREGLVAAKLAGVPVVIHGEHGKLQDRKRQIVIQRWGWRRVKSVLSVSAALADRMADKIGFPRERVQVIPNGVDTERFAPSGTDGEELRRQLGLPAQGFLIGMLARFVPFKNHAGVLRALSELAGAGTDCHLALAGDGPLRQELAQLAELLGITHRVHFLGALKDVRPLLEAVDIVVSNSTHNEGMSNTMLESMACGTPVVATRVAASPELLDDGKSGLLVEPGDTGELVSALRRLVDDRDLRQALSTRCRQRVESHYSIDAMVESYRQLYLQLSCDSNTDFAGLVANRVAGT